MAAARLDSPHARRRADPGDPLSQRIPASVREVRMAARPVAHSRSVLRVVDRLRRRPYLRPTVVAVQPLQRALRTAVAAGLLRIARRSCEFGASLELELAPSLRLCSCAVRVRAGQLQPGLACRTGMPRGSRNQHEDAESARSPALDLA